MSSCIKPTSTARARNPHTGAGRFPPIGAGRFPLIGAPRPTLAGLSLAIVLSLLFGGIPAGGQEILDLPGWDQPVEAHLEDIYSVGAMDGDDWETFSRISSVAFDAQGNLLVLDGGNQRIVKIDTFGSLHSEMGRKGEGPGEFGAPSSMAVTDEGAIVVFDLTRKGFTLFHSDGTFYRTVPLVNGFEAMPGKDILPHPSKGVVSVGGEVLVVRADGPQSMGDASKRPIYSYSLEDGTSETLFRCWRPEAKNPLAGAGGGLSGRAMVYAGSGKKVYDAEVHFGVLPDGLLAVVDSVTYAVKLVGDDGVVRRVLKRPIEPRDVTRRDQEKERARRRETLESGGGGGIAVIGGGTATLRRGPPSAEIIEERIGSLEFADQIPVVQGLAVDREGRIWVERVGTEVGEKGPIDLLTSDGRYLGSFDQTHLRIPDAFGPKGLVAFVEKDEFDVPRVEVKRLSLG